MMKRNTILAICAVLLIGNLAQAKDDITKELITSGGRTRAYYLYVPSATQPTTPVPLVIMLHGSDRTGISLVEKWKDLAKKEGFIIAGPDSINARGWGSPQDGPDFLHELVEQLRAKYPINSKRMYLFGHSAGASFALQMALLESQYFAATAIHAGALRGDDTSLIELAKRKIPISIQVGDSDQYFPLNLVRSTRDSLQGAGFVVELMEIPGHDHWYYDLAPKINRTSWDFLRKHELDSEPQYRKYNF